MLDNTISIHTDGGSRGNPGPAACGFVVEEGESVLHKGSKYLGRATNNHAEYFGVIAALTWLKDERSLLKRNIVFYLDSELIVRQINGIYKVKDVNLQKLNKEVKNIIEETGVSVIFKNVPREHNKIADALVNECLDKNS